MGKKSKKKKEIKASREEVMVKLYVLGRRRDVRTVRIGFHGDLL